MAGVGSAVGQGISRKMYVTRTLGLEQSTGTNVGHNINLRVYLRYHLEPVPIKALVTVEQIFYSIVADFLCST